MERAIADDPRQPRHYFNLATELAAEGNDSHALEVFSAAIDRWFEAHGADTGYVPAMFAQAAWAANRLDRRNDALMIHGRE